eukprot:GCRY01003858.1.p1 GENE.GCRY01003858.1~~GCRY01003858.1.p1  ORF type:complete len:261 (-),score=32.51 GCRY01003858.1:138-920(-)
MFLKKGVPLSFVSFLLILIVYSVSIYLIRRILSSPTVHITIITIFVALSLLSFFGTLLVDSGHFHTVKWNPSQALYFNGEFIVDFENGKNKYCNYCRTLKPPRAHHCSHCNRCVARYDHLCPWLSTCIGMNNHRLFIQFLLYLSAAVLYGFGVLVCCFGKQLQSASQSRYSQPNTFDVILLSLDLFVLFPVLLLLGSLLRYQLGGILHNCTTVEDWVLEDYIYYTKKPSASKPFPYNLGLWQNVRQVFGRRAIAPRSPRQ